MKHIRDCTVIFPHQLFKHHPAIEKNRPIVILEDKHFFTRFAFHKKKLVFHRASILFYTTYLQKKGFSVFHVPYTESDDWWLQAKKYTLHCVDPIEQALLKKLKQKSSRLILYESPAFLSSRTWLEGYFKKTKTFNQTSFYREQRKRLSLLMDHGKPLKGRWTFDIDNRKALPKTIVIPHIKKINHNLYVKKALKEILQSFQNNPGSIEAFEYPITFTDAQKWLQDFLEKRLHHFGDYEDALHKNEVWLFHSVLSPLLNSGLLTPEEVLEKTLTYASKHRIALNNLEGFIRQIIGWREFVRGVYYVTQGSQAKKNVFHHTRTLSEKWYTGTTGLKPLDTTIKRVQQHAYCHHIERLMIIGNAMLLSKIAPNEVYRWFMELFIDAYDWVMVPNVFGMSQYADGGLMVSKPYISGSNYIYQMSNYKKEDWGIIWDALYWNFIYEKKAFIKKNPRLAVMRTYLNRMPKTTLKKHRTRAQSFLKE